MRIAIAQLNYHIGNFSENLSKISHEIKHARQKGCDLIVFSELSVCGYPPLDLLEQDRFIRRCWQAVEDLKAETGGIGVLIGAPLTNTGPAGKRLFNAACFLYEGKVSQVFRKTLLPTYDIFDEYRYFEPNREFELLVFKGKKIAVTICEDLWFEQPLEGSLSSRRLYTQNPVEELMKQGADLLVNLSASPFAHNRIEAKRRIFTDNARRYRVPVLFVNQVGAQTELIFEGGSLVLNALGNVVSELESFREGSLVFDLDQLQQDASPAASGFAFDRIANIYEALVMGVRDYFAKMGFRKAVLGLSGGIDSSVSLVIAADALGRDNVHSLLLPSEYSSGHSITDALALTENLDTDYSILGIHEIYHQFLSVFRPVFRDRKEDITEENIQSRIRGTLLMAFSNKYGHILLNTSNKSEAAVGYGTLYGDMTGGLSILGDVYKTDVYRLANFINRNGELIPRHVIDKPPSAELKPGQKDSDSLPEYDLLDAVLFAYIEQQKDTESIIESGFNEQQVKEIINRVNQNEYKRYQTPPILRISTKAFGAGRRMPLVARY